MCYSVDAVRRTKLYDAGAQDEFVRPVFASTGALRCEGVVLSFGGRIASSEGKVFDKEGNLVAHGTETCLIMGQRNGAASQV